MVFRPIAGIANFCPGRIDGLSDQELIDVGIHEVLHALVCIVCILYIHECKGTILRVCTIQVPANS